MLTVAAFVFVAQHTSRSAICQSELPPNIRPGLFRREMIRLLEASETFRQQCRRVEQTPYVWVRIGMARSVPAGGRAETLIERFEAGAIVATVTLRFSEDYLELIPHELEHVIEQIDRVRLADEVENQRASVRKGGVFETRRAIAAGLRVRQELSTSVVEPVQGDKGKPPTPRRQFD